MSAKIDRSETLELERDIVMKWSENSLASRKELSGLEPFSFDDV